MPSLTEMERVAVKSAKRPLFEALVKIGRADAFNTATAEDMESVIEAIWSACRASLREQNQRINHRGAELDDEIPF